MEYFVQQLINGVTLGAIYGLIAIGYTMVYGIIGMINFAHGDVFMIGAFIALIALSILGIAGVTWVPLALLIVLIIAMLLTAAYGWTVERIAYRPLRGSFRLAPLISAIGMSIFLQNYVQIAQGARVKPLQPVIQGGVIVMEKGNFTVSLSYMQMIIVVVTITLMTAFSLLIAKTVALFDVRYRRDLVTAFAELERAGGLELITTAATHGYLPLLRHGPGSVRAQARTWRARSSLPAHAGPLRPSGPPSTTEARWVAPGPSSSDSHGPVQRTIGAS